MMAAGDTHNPLARHPAGDHRNYKARHPHRCRCQLCTSAYTAKYNEYRTRVRSEVRRGTRPTPTWMENQTERDRRRRPSKRDAHEQLAEILMTEIVAHSGVAFDDIVYLPQQGRRPAQIRATVYLDGEA